MRRSILPSACLAAGALLCLAASAPAADLDKYLPDDAQVVAVVNVKQITAWTPFQKQFQDQIQQALKNGPPAELLKDTGFDPLRDLDRVVIVAAADSPQIIKPPPRIYPPGPPPPPPTAGTDLGRWFSPYGFPTFFLLQGNFDADKLEAKLQQALKDHADVVKKPRAVHGMELWELNVGREGDSRLYLAMLDKETLMATGLESQALEALEKAAGKKKTDLQDKLVRDAFANEDMKAALTVVCSGDVVTSVSAKADGKGGFTTATRAIRDYGGEGYNGAVTLGDADLHAEITATFKDADKAKEAARIISAASEKIVKQSQVMIDLDKERAEALNLPALIEAAKTLTATTSDATVSVEARATPDAIEGQVRLMGFLPEPAPPRPPGDSSPKKDP